ncbi:MAG: hypothetical protein RIQ52_172 [Pseudomonadota bacterium]
MRTAGFWYWRGSMTKTPGVSTKVMTMLAGCSAGYWKAVIRRMTEISC